MKLMILKSYDDTHMGNWFDESFIYELKKLDYNINLIKLKPYDSIVEFKEQILLDLASCKFDYFITTFNHKTINGNLINEINKYTKSILLLCDNLIIPFEHKKTARYYNLVWLTSKETQYLFQRWKAKSIFLPYAATVKNLDEYNLLTNPLIRKVVFIGSPYGSRVNIINKLLSKGIPVDIYKPQNVSVEKKTKRPSIKVFYNFIRFSIGRKIIIAKFLQMFLIKPILDIENKNLNIFPGLSLEDMQETYKKYALCLSSVHARNTGILKSPVEIVNLRNFEIPSSGGIQFCQRTSEMANYFEDNKEIVFYNSLEDIDKIARKILINYSDSQLYEIQKNAYIKAKHSHTWSKRFEILFKYFERI